MLGHSTRWLRGKARGVTGSHSKHSPYSNYIGKMCVSYQGVTWDPGSNVFTEQIEIDRDSLSSPASPSPLSQNTLLTPPLPRLSGSPPTICSQDGRHRPPCFPRDGWPRTHPSPRCCNSRGCPAGMGSGPPPAALPPL